MNSVDVDYTTTAMTFTDSINDYAPRSLQLQRLFTHGLHTFYKKRHYLAYRHFHLTVAKRLVVQTDTLNAVNKNILHKNTRNHMYMYKTDQVEAVKHRTSKDIYSNGDKENLGGLLEMEKKGSLR